MNTKLLKQKVLDLAIHGKLVPQNPNDEPASVLLEKIRTEKEEKIKKGELKRNKNDSYIIKDDNGKYYDKFMDDSLIEISNDIPFNLPENWTWCRFKEVYQVINGDRGKNYPAKTSLSSEGIPFVSALNIKNNIVIKDENLLCLSDVQYEKLNSGKLTKGDMVLCIRGSIGKHGIYPFEKGAIASSLVIIRKKYPILEEMLNFYFDTPLFNSELRKYDNGTTQPNLAAESLKQFIFPLPPIEEQQRIAEQIEKIFAQIDLLEENQSDLSELIDKSKAKILDLAIHGNLVEQDANDEPASVLLEKIRAEKEEKIKKGELKRDKKESYIFKDDKGKYFEKFVDESLVNIQNNMLFRIPKSWEWCMLGDIINVSSAKRVLQQDWTDSGVPFYRAREVVQLATDAKVIDDLFITEELYNKLKSDYGVPKSGDLLVSAVGSIGKVYIVKDEDKFYYKDASVLLFSKKDNRIDSRYIKYLFESSFLQNQMYSKSKGTTVDTITINIANRYFIPLPPFEEQKRIVRKIQDLYKILEKILNILD